jgi:tRNA pseudouridine38-40 synthase
MAIECKRVAMAIQYVGTHICGWQRQPNGRSVQGDIEDAIEQIIGSKVTLHGAGRTDSGVHAAAQFAHFDDPSRVPASRWANLLNGRLPSDIVIRASTEVAADWHARFSATYRRYRYSIYTAAQPNLFLRPFCWHYYHQPLDALAMQAAIAPLVGRHHLAAFHRAGSSRPHSWVDVHQVQCDRFDDSIQIEIQAKGFLYGMVRLLVGTLVHVGSGKISPAEFTRIWQQESRTEIKYAAPPTGLCLLRVGYAQELFPRAVWYDAQPHWSLPAIDRVNFDSLRP